MKPKRKRPSKEIKKQLEQIYSEQDGQLPDLTHLEKREHSKVTRILLTIIGILLAISAAAWVGFFVWTQAMFQGTDDLQVMIEGPDEIVSGEEVYYTIRYENLQRTALHDLELVINFPDSFQMISSSITPTMQTQWNLDNLASYSDGALVLGGIFRSSQDTTETIQAVFSYRPANTHSKFQEIGIKKIAVSDSVLNLAMTGPETALVGDEISYSIDLQNTGEDNAELLAILLTFPESFTVTRTNPTEEEATFEETEEGLRYEIGLLETGKLETVTFYGEFTSEAEGKQTTEAKAIFLNKDDDEAVAAIESIETEVLGGTLSFSLISNGSTEDQTIGLGKTLRVSLDYQNVGPETISDLVFTLSLDTLEEEEGKLPIDFDLARWENGEITSDGIVWNSENTDDFAALASGEAGVIDLSIPIPDELDLDTYADQFTMTLLVDIGSVGSITEDRIIETNPLLVSINSNATFDAETRFYNDDGSTTGSGNEAPEVGSSSTYTIHWTIDNNLHDLKDVRVSTTIPSAVTWSDWTKSDVGSISFDSVTRTASWDISSLPTGTGEVEAWFDLTVRPTNDDIGSFLKLTDDISFMGTDVITEDIITSSSTFLSTDLSEDPHATESGVVIE